MSATVRDWGLFTLHQGDCVGVLQALPDASVDSVVCDPPYGIRFMGKAWDGADIEKTFRETNLDAGRRARGGRAAAAGKYELTPAAMLAFQQFSENWAREAFRVLKPGGHLLSFASTRTYHRMVCGIEDAGFDIRDQIGWVFGSGFAKAQVWTQDKADAGDTEVAALIAAGFEGWARGGLKPAWEPICVARKPVVGTAAENVLAFGTGALNIDACRVPTTDDLNGGAYAAERQASAGTWAGQGTLHETTGREFVQPIGRFPANLIHDGSDEVLALFPQSVGPIADASSSSRKTQNVYGAMTRGNGEASRDSENEGGFRMRPSARRGDTGSAARFFKQCSFDEDDKCLANTAGGRLAPENEVDVFALAHAVRSAFPAGLLVAASLSTPLFTNATPKESRLLSNCAIETILSFDAKFWLEQRPVELSLSHNHANTAVRREPTGTTTITTSLSRSDGSAEPATLTITLTNSEVGGKVFGPSTAARFTYCAKASRADRGAGNGHPTVKPTDLMRYLCRLVTPPGGTVLDPFMGSGSTGKAAIKEGFRFIGVDLSAEYLDIAERRIAHAAFGDLAFGAAAA